MARRSRRPRRSAPWDYVERTRHLTVNVVFLAPWLLVYLLCWALAGDSVETAAAVSLRSFLRLLGPRTLFALTLLVALGLCAVVVLRVRAAGVDGAVFPGMVAEGVAYGLALHAVAEVLAWIFPVGRWVGLFGFAEPLDEVRRLGIAVGAGIFEELLFRGVVCLGLVRLLRDVVGADRWTSWTAAVVLSAAAFSAYHHWGPGAEPWSAEVFAFRFHAGVVLGVVFLARGLGIAAFAHGFYDALVLLGG
jgi:membrane protease YdiL (CAAX protease family)